MYVGKSSTNSVVSKNVIKIDICLNARKCMSKVDDVILYSEVGNRIRGAAAYTKGETSQYITWIDACCKDKTFVVNTKYCVIEGS